MKQFAWFPLSIKAVGILLIGMSLSSLLYPLQIIGWAFDGSVPFGTGQLVSAFIMSFGPLVQFAFGLYLLLGGRRIIARCLKMVDGHCLVCGYDVRGLKAEVCPECGTKLNEKADTASTAGFMGSGTASSLGGNGEGDGAGRD